MEGKRLVVHTHCPNEIGMTYAEECHCGAFHPNEKGSFELKGVPLDVMARIKMVCDKLGVKYDLCLSTKTNPGARRNSEPVLKGQESISTRLRSNSGPLPSRPPSVNGKNISTSPVSVPEPVRKGESISTRPRSKSGLLPSRRQENISTSPVEVRPRSKSVRSGPPPRFVNGKNISTSPVEVRPRSNSEPLPEREPISTPSRLRSGSTASK